MECQDCEYFPCICENESIRQEMIMTLMSFMQEKVFLYQKLMESRVNMIREDMICSIIEVTNKFQEDISRKISNLDEFVSGLQQADYEVNVTPDILEAINYHLDLNLDSENLQLGFNKAIVGEFVVFRELLKFEKHSSVSDHDEDIE